MYSFLPIDTSSKNPAASSPGAPLLAVPIWVVMSSPPSDSWKHCVNSPNTLSWNLRKHEMGPKRSKPFDANLVEPMPAMPQTTAAFALSFKLVYSTPAEAFEVKQFVKDRSWADLNNTMLSLLQHVLSYLWYLLCTKYSFDSNSRRLSPRPRYCLMRWTESFHLHALSIRTFLMYEKVWIANRSEINVSRIVVITFSRTMMPFEKSCRASFCALGGWFLPRSIAEVCLPWDRPYEVGGRGWERAKRHRIWSVTLDANWSL